MAIATSGPGVGNLITGLATANSEGDPMAALGGSVATSQSLKQIHQTAGEILTNEVKGRTAKIMVGSEGLEPPTSCL